MELVLSPDGRLRGGQDELNTFVAQIELSLGKIACVGLLLYGSSTGPRRDRFSDIDLVILTNDAKQSTERFLKIGGRDVDVSVVDSELLTRMINLRRWRDNHILFALLTGIILLDRDLTLHKFSHLAKSLFFAESTGLADPMRVQILDRTAKLLRISQKLESRALQSHSELEIAANKLQMGWVFINLTELFARSKGRFWFPLWVLPKLPRHTFYAEIMQRHLVFAQASTLQDQVASISALAVRVKGEEVEG